MKYPELDKESLFIRTYSDASFGANPDRSSQLGFCIFLMDNTGRFSLIKYWSSKCRRICQSAMAAEACAFADTFDAAYVLKHELDRLLGRDVSLQMLIDSKQVFEAISHSTRTKERRVMIDLAATKQAFERTEITDLGLVSGSSMMADAFTKIRKPKKLLQDFRDQKITHQIERWIVRDLPTSEKENGAVWRSVLMSKSRGFSYQHRHAVALDSFAFELYFPTFVPIRLLEILPLFCVPRFLSRT
eukprot:Plantae.Rhodophyta-Palmaria_palmata.ctg10239.p1 GENE.Plantae.Rhodophyta-Palmaria_palmata.ctg10239~~Plantae.Rhodophyta-Palmaria_palmata.ctg10239.p1  ORF type:complete len:245 (+),score=21.58 Plantae.Rhodophyta-Palmaria_palmata.ctg10239:319-1053(+)